VLTGPKLPAPGYAGRISFKAHQLPDNSKELPANDKPAAFIEHNFRGLQCGLKETIVARKRNGSSS
jgi:hypothetical protein